MKKIFYLILGIVMTTLAILMGCEMSKPIKTNYDFIVSEVSAPATPTSEKVVIYKKTDGLLYFKDSSGVETILINYSDEEIKHLKSFYKIKAPFASVDTVSVSVTLNAEDWVWSIGSIYDFVADSLIGANLIKLIDTLKSINISSWTQNITIPNANGKMILEFFKIYRQTTGGELEHVGLDMRNTLLNINNTTLQSAFNVIDAPYQGQYNFKIQRARLAAKKN